MQGLSLSLLWNGQVSKENKFSDQPTQSLITEQAFRISCKKVLPTCDAVRNKTDSIQPPTASAGLDQVIAQMREEPTQLRPAKPHRQRASAVCSLHCGNFE